MKYMGSERRIAKDILPIILADRLVNQTYVEPFMGGCNSLAEVNGDRLACDNNKYIVAMWSALVNEAWQPPNAVSEAEYSDIKANKSKYPEHLVGFCGVALTFGSTWMGTYARNKRGTNYAMEGRKNLMKQVEKLKGVSFKHSSYADLIIPDESIIYCDPPYKGVYGYKHKFNHDAFYSWCLDARLAGHTIFISEYAMPE